MEAYREYLERHADDMTEALRSVIRINSEAGEPVHTAAGELYPFGEGVQKAFLHVLDMASEMGFETFNADNYGGHIDFPGRVRADEGGRVMAILGHLDVVPAGSGWKHGPYDAEIEDGRIYGRGTTDDKGPMIACLYAMKALKDCGFVPEHTVRMILGLDEETNWYGMDHYFSVQSKPDFGFTPDADFPVINGEKGMLVFELAKKFEATRNKGLELRSLKGGTAPNSVPDSARAVVRSTAKNPEAAYEKIKELAKEYREETGRKVHVKAVGKSLEITSEGVSAHGAKPELGLNAISVMMEFLGRMSFVNDDVNEFIGFYNSFIGFDLEGGLIGAAMEDEKSGKLVFNVGMAEANGEAGKYVINIRYPVTSTDDEVYARMLPLIEKYDFGLIKGKHHAPIYIDTESPLVKDLMSAYVNNTGDTESKPLVIGGGTYARSAKNVVAFGAMFPGDEDLMHQANENISIERFRQLSRIYLEAIVKLSTGDYAF